jgi:hypothetical protein
LWLACGAFELLSLLGKGEKKRLGSEKMTENVRSRYRQSFSTLRRVLEHN